MSFHPKNDLHKCEKVRLSIWTFWICFKSSMSSFKGGIHLRPRVRFSTPEREAPAPTLVPAPVPSSVPEAVPEEPQGFRGTNQMAPLPGTVLNY